MQAAKKAAALAKGSAQASIHQFAPELEEAIVSVEEKLGMEVPERQKRFFAIKLLEKDDKIRLRLDAVPDVGTEISRLEEELDDDTESIITNERYVYISSIIGECCTKNQKKKVLTGLLLTGFWHFRFLHL